MNFTKFVAGFDIHGDKQNRDANRVFFKFVEDHWKPEIRICGGDVWDFRPLRKKADENERREDMKPDFDAGMAWLERLKPTHFLRGNHDERLWELAANGSGICQTYAKEGIADISQALRKFKCRVFPYHKRTGVLRLGHLKVIHGFFSGIYASRQTALVYGSCLFGHIHTIDEHATPGLERRVARCCGCLCETDMEYNARQPMTLRQANGFAFGIVDKRSGKYHVWQAERVGGKWIIPSDIVEL